MSGAINFLPLIINQLPPNCRNCLDIGCGNGELAAELASRAHRVMAFDLDESSIAEAGRRFESTANLDFRIGDVLQLDRVIGDVKFDCIVSAFALHHVDVQHALQMMKRCLSPRGVIIILDLYANRKESSAAYLFDQFFLSNLRQLSALSRTVRDIRLIKAWRFLLWRMAYAASVAGRRHIKEDLLRDSPFSRDQWHMSFQKELPCGIERILMGSVFIYIWKASPA